MKIATLKQLRELPDDIRKFLISLLRHGASEGFVHQRLRERFDVELAPEIDFDEFLRDEARERWRRRFESAAVEADAIIASYPDALAKLDDALIATLKQETFRLLVQEDRDLDAPRIKQFFELLLRHRDRERHDATLQLAREKFELARRSRIEQALDAFAAQLDTAQGPVAGNARTHYEALRQTILGEFEESESTGKTKSPESECPI